MTDNTAPPHSTREAAMSEKRPDKCPTCGIAREHDGPRYRAALKQAGKPMCPDTFHDPELGDIHDNTAPKRAYLRVCRNPDEPFFWDADTPNESRSDPRIIMLSDEPRPFRADPAPDGETVECVPLDRLREVERERDTLREALETICEIGETRDVEIARRALASLDEQEGQR